LKASINGGLMKLYYSPGVCSLSPHIVLREAGLVAELVKVDLKTKKTQNKQDFVTIVDKNYVPALELDNGEILTEGAVIVQYLADQNPDAKLLPASGSLERYRVQEWLNFIGSEIHKAHWPLFHPETGAAAQDIYREKLGKTYSYLSSKLEGKSYLMGETFTIADAYLFTVLNWHKFVNINLNEWPLLIAYIDRVKARPKVQETLKAEGLI
jgi:glutathione S-transferase